MFRLLASRLPLSGPGTRPRWDANERSKVTGRPKERLHMNAYVTAGALMLMGVLSTQAFGEQKYSDWGPAIHLGCDINSPSNDFGPAISKDGLSLYFSSNRGANVARIWVAQRQSTSDPWGPPQPLGQPVYSGGGDNNPSFAHTRGIGCSSIATNALVVSATSICGCLTE